jgi:hypothetical protein
METGVDKATELRSANPSQKDVLREVKNRFKHWNAQYKESGETPHSAEIDALGQALHGSYFSKQLKPAEVREIVEHFSSHYPESFAEWVKESEERILLENISVQRIVALARAYNRKKKVLQ